MSRVVMFQAEPMLETMLRRELGIGIRPVFTITKSGFYWCELRLPQRRFTRGWVCCPGETKRDALQNAIKQARRHERNQFGEIDAAYACEGGLA